MKQAERLYEQYGKLLEQEHWGEYIAISPDGRFILGKNHLEGSDQALSQFGRGSFLFGKVGERALGRWR